MPLIDNNNKELYKDVELKFGNKQQFENLNKQLERMITENLKCLDDNKMNIYEYADVYAKVLIALEQINTMLIREDRHYLDYVEYRKKEELNKLKNKIVCDNDGSQ